MNTPTQTPSPDERSPAWERWIPWAILALVVLIVFAVSTRWDSFVSNSAVQTTDYASIETDSALISAKVSGYVRQVAFTDFQPVHAGDLLVQIDDRELRADVMRAEATLARAQAVLANLDNEVAAGRATVSQAQAAEATNASKLRLAEQDNRRFSALEDSGAVTGQEADSARSNMDAVRSTQQGTRASVELQQRQLDVLRGERGQREADVRAAEAALDLARINLSYARITAPADGFVSERQVQAGSLVNAGSAIVNFVPRTPPYIVANYKETQLARVRTGQPVEISIDSFPGETLRGRITRIGPASGASFAALPADNATGNFTKVTQRIPLRIDLLANQPLIARLRAGMSVTTHVDTSGSD
jgi:membrane fusion protein (multidrug efflux system)